MKTGLVLGKFAPLHAGHQLVIETALSEMDHVVVLVYDCPDIETWPLPVRSKWIRDIYPAVEVLEAWDGPTETGLDPAITARHDDYLRKRLRNRVITHFYSSEQYGEHVSMALHAQNRLVDLGRASVPISGSAIRLDPFSHKDFIPPRVYRDLIKKVVFVGAPSTGKSTIASALAARHATVWMPEYGREYWQLHQQNRRLSLYQLTEIAIGHRNREDDLLKQANTYLFVDTDATTTLQFSYCYHEAADRELIRLADEAFGRYDVRFLCEADIPYEDTWDRSGEVDRSVMQRRIEADLIARKTNFHRLAGPLEDRIHVVEEILKQTRLWQPKYGGP